MDLISVIGSLSLELKRRISENVAKLYNFSLQNAREIFDKLQQEVEQKIGLHSYIVDRLARKLTFDLKLYTTYENADWFITQRLGRVGSNHFGTLLTRSHVAKHDVDLNDLLNIAKSENNIPKQLLIMATISIRYLEDQKILESQKMLEDIEGLLEHTRQTMFGEREDRWYLVLAYHEISFMYQKHNNISKSVNYLTHALRTIEEDDLGLCLITQRYLIKAQKLENTDNEIDLELCEQVFFNLEKAFSNIECIELLYGVKPIIVYFTDNIIYSRSRIDRINLIGKLCVGWLKEHYGECYHLLGKMGSALAYQNIKLGCEEEASRYYIDVKEILSKKDEYNDFQLDVKIKSCQNVAMYLKYLQLHKEAERYQREMVELIKKRYSNRNKYLANSLCFLALTVKELGRTDEAIKLMTENLQILRECNLQSLAYKAEEILESWSMNNNFT